MNGSKPVSIQPDVPEELYSFSNDWHQNLFDSFKPCPTSALACFCTVCFIAKLNDRTGEHVCTCCINPCALMALRTKVRTVFHIRGSLVEDCYTTVCCVCPCAAMQIEKELDYQGVHNKRPK